MNKTSVSSVLTIALFLGMLVASPVAAADAVSRDGNRVGACVVASCVVTQTDSNVVTQTQTCGGSGNIIFQAGNNNTVNICSQNQTSGNYGY